MTARIHFHTDCYSFSGSETTLMLLLGDAFHDEDVSAQFTYRRWPEYEAGLARNLPAHVRARGLRLPDPADAKHALTGGRTGTVPRAVRGAITLLPLRQLCFAYDVVRFVALFRRSRPDVLHVNNGGLPGAISCNAAAIAGRLAGVPVIVFVVNNLAYPYDRPGRWLDYPVDRALVGAVTKFVTGSAAAGHALRRVLRLADRQHVALANGVEARRPSTTPAETRRALGVADGAPVVAVVARLEARKGHRHLLDAIALLPEDLRRDVCVLVAGAGPERERLERQATEVDAHVRFLGEHPDPWSLYEIADLVVLPSVDHEDLPVVLIEAMAVGRAVVASRVAGAAELVDDDVTGLLVPPGDPRALATAIEELLGDRERRTMMGKAAVERYEAAYTPERVVAAYRALHRQLVAEVER